MNDEAFGSTLEQDPVDKVSIATIRTLAMDAVEQANSGHPGTPMALAPAAYVLWQRLLKHNPANPRWFDRDRFVLSAGHASMLLYGLLHLTGYDLPLEEIRNFRQWGSRTPGHPEHGVTPGVETTTGPLGQGLMNAVGMAIAEAHLSAKFNRDGHTIVDHRTWVFASDGDLMEGASHEAASLAGHLGLGKLIVLYDDNHISIDGRTEIAYSDDVAGRFGGYHWHVQNLAERANDVEALHAAFQLADNVAGRPSLIIVRSHIAEGAPNARDTAAAHGSPLGEDEVRAAKNAYDWPETAHFLVPDRVKQHMGQARERGAEAERQWHLQLESLRREQPELAGHFERIRAGELPAGWDAGLPHFTGEQSQMATRSAAGKVLNACADQLPELLGGSADLASSTKAMLVAGGDFSAHSPQGRNIHWGVREHAMCGACSGMALHGGVRPFASTFLIFTDYARPAIRLAALMKQPVIYLMTHDSIGLGEDGPTHQPVEHLASLRAIPNLTLIRPADAGETTEAWRVAVERHDGPTLLVLTRQKLPVFDRRHLARAEGVSNGAYILSPEQDTPDLILIASGSEVHLALSAQGHLRTENGIDARVVSMPSWELFRAQSSDYRDEVLPPEVRPRIAIEAGATQGWLEWVGCEGDVIGLDHFGASAPGPVLLEKFGFTAGHIVERARRLVLPD
ncbi:transketolase [Thiohalomonas denitrificans]|uniref:transketolase n=1 Tax=Thiohalomonas denitrificans TaxID=415747 RepID=UPI0026EEFE9C|nr:transketolase [Thiohalomonas denitrificans]